MDTGIDMANYFKIFYISVICNKAREKMRYKNAHVILIVDNYCRKIVQNELDTYTLMK